MRLMTWNMQGGNAGKYTDVTSLMAQHKVQVACLQECGTLPAGWLKGARTTTHNGVTVSEASFSAGKGVSYTVINFDNAAAGNNRCSLAVVCEPAVLGIDAVAGPGGLRPLIGLKVPGDIWIYSIHAPSGNANAAAGSASSMLGTLTAAKWTCLGDYNCPSSQINVAGASVAAGSRATQQSGGGLDYAVSRGVTLTPREELATAASDHYAQFFDT